MHSASFSKPAIDSRAVHAVAVNANTVASGAKGLDAGEARVFNVRVEFFSFG